MRLCPDATVAFITVSQVPAGALGDVVYEYV
jgi:hypothetical protein